MGIQTILALLNLFFGGVLVGLEVCAHHGFHAPTLLLDQASQIRFRQAAVRKLRWLVPAFFAPALLCGIGLAVLEGNSAGYLFRYIGLAALLIWIALRATGTVPINAATLDWNPDAPPADWKTRIEKAERFHVVGTWAALTAFACFLISLGVVFSGLASDRPADCCPAAHLRGDDQDARDDQDTRDRLLRSFNGDRRGLRARGFAIIGIR